MCFLCLVGGLAFCDDAGLFEGYPVGDDGAHAGEAVPGFGDFVDLLAAGVRAGDHEGAGDERDQQA
jgi:hypothetical protein